MLSAAFYYAVSFIYSVCCGLFVVFGIGCSEANKNRLYSSETRDATYRAAQKQERPGSPEPQGFLEYRRAKHQLGQLVARRYHAIAVVQFGRAFRQQRKHTRRRRLAEIEPDYTSELSKLWRLRPHLLDQEEDLANIMGVYLVHMK